MGAQSVIRSRIRHQLALGPSSDPLCWVFRPGSSDQADQAGWGQGRGKATGPSGLGDRAGGPATTRSRY